MSDYVDSSFRASGFFARLKGLIARPADTLPGPGAHDRVQLAVCVLLLEVAEADDEFTAQERACVRDVLAARFSLDRLEVEGLMGAARERRAESMDLWHFTHEINESWSRDEKLAFMEEVWRLIYADGTLSGHEDYLVHQLAKLLNLAHPDLIQAKLEVLRTRRGQD